MSSLRVLRSADYRAVHRFDGCLVREIASAAVSVGDAAESTAAWRLDLVDLAPGAEWRSTGSGMLGVVANGQVLLGDAPLPHGAVSSADSGDSVGNVGAQNASIVVLSLDRSRALGELTVAGPGERDLVGFSWFLVATAPVRVRINDDPFVELESFDTARIDLRARPVSRLGLEPREPRPALAASARLPASTPLAFLAIASR